MERIFLVGVRLFRDVESKASPASFSLEGEMANKHAIGE
jgi:hypothetical protein